MNNAGDVSPSSGVARREDIKRSGESRLRGEENLVATIETVAITLHRAVDAIDTRKSSLCLFVATEREDSYKALLFLRVRVASGNHIDFNPCLV